MESVPIGAEDDDACGGGGPVTVPMMRTGMREWVPFGHSAGVEQGYLMHTLRTC